MQLLPGVGTDSLVAARVQLEPSFLVQSREVIHVGDIGSFDVHPDGNRILIEDVLPQNETADGEPEPQRVVVILNWFEELKAKVGN